LGFFEEGVLMKAEGVHLHHSMSVCYKAKMKSWTPVETLT